MTTKFQNHAVARKSLGLTVEQLTKRFNASSARMRQLTREATRMHNVEFEENLFNVQITPNVSLVGAVDRRNKQILVLSVRMLHNGHFAILQNRCFPVLLAIISLVDPSLTLEECAEIVPSLGLTLVDDGRFFVDGFGLCHEQNGLYYSLSTPSEGQLGFDIKCSGLLEKQF